MQESLLFMKIDSLTAKDRGFTLWGILTMKTSKDIMESLGVNWDFVRVESISFFRGKNKFKEKTYMYENCFWAPLCLFLDCRVLFQMPGGQ